jgi:hypothetical protein
MAVIEEFGRFKVCARRCPQVLTAPVELTAFCGRGSREGWDLVPPFWTRIQVVIDLMAPRDSTSLSKKKFMSVFGRKNHAVEPLGSLTTIIQTIISLHACFSRVRPATPGHIQVWAPLREAGGNTYSLFKRWKVTPDNGEILCNDHMCD